MKEMIDRFEVGTEDGERHIVCVYEDVIPAGTSDDPHATIRGKLKEYRTTEGYAVNVVDAQCGVFEILLPLGRAEARTL